MTEHDVTDDVRTALRGLEPPDFDPTGWADRARERAGRRTGVARRPMLVTLGAAAAVLAVIVGVSVATSGGGDDQPVAGGPSAGPTDVPTGYPEVAGTTATGTYLGMDVTLTVPDTTVAPGGSLPFDLRVVNRTGRTVRETGCGQPPTALGVVPVDRPASRLLDGAVTALCLQRFPYAPGETDRRAAGDRFRALDLREDPLRPGAYLATVELGIGEDALRLAVPVTVTDSGSEAQPAELSCPGNLASFTYEYFIGPPPTEDSPAGISRNYTDGTTENPTRRVLASFEVVDVSSSAASILFFGERAPSSAVALMQVKRDGGRGWYPSTLEYCTG